MNLNNNYDSCGTKHAPLLAAGCAAAGLTSRLDLYKKDKENILHLLEEIREKNINDIVAFRRYDSFYIDQTKLNPEYIIGWAKTIIETNPKFPKNAILQRMINEFYALNSKIETAKELMKRSLFLTSLIVLLSIFLLPLGSVNINSDNRFLLKILSICVLCILPFFLHFHFPLTSILSNKTP
ncbi:MAG: hypothetical protein J5U19_07860 [Candidatus Methanoperedens sp.]|nr:hypothetical protein [Candidatus Methanoperedens sp.]